MVITGLYAGILAPIFIVLTMRVVILRVQKRVQFGDGGSEALLRRVRIHGNFIEYVPLALILMGILDTQLVDPVWLHALGITLVVARLLHAVGLSIALLPARVLGVLLTLTVIGIEAILAIMHYMS